MDSYKIKQLETMLAYEQEQDESNQYGAHLTHWSGHGNPINIDAGAIRALLAYYKKETVLDEMLNLLDAQQTHCMDAGATVEANTLARPKNGNEEQNSYYYGHLNMAQMIAWNIGKDIAKRNGKHILIDER